MARKFALVEREEEEESSSEEEEEEEPQEQHDEESGGEEEGEQDAEPAVTTPGRANGTQRGKLKIKINRRDRASCKVCGAFDHQAGFVGATYVDCPNKPCYLCKMPGHTTATCPFKVAPGLDCTPAAGSQQSTGISLALRDRELGRGSRSPGQADMMPTPRYQVDAAIYKLHTRRCCTLEFHQTNDSIVISGDKKGGIAIWDFDRVHERTMYSNVHSCLTNQIKMVPWHGPMTCCTASSDGTAKLLDLEVGTSTELVDLNPNGWRQGGPWHMFYGCAADQRNGHIFLGDSSGLVHVVDCRAPQGSHLKAQLHRKDKVTSLDVHPLDSHLLLTGSNDHTAKLFDVRAFSGSATSPATPSPTGKGRGGSAAKFAAPGELACMQHPRVVNNAVFSPHTGRKILTTCQNNRICVWDSLLDVRGPPSREIVHSHDFNRYLTPFKAEWDPKDAAERRFVIGRYISEEFNGVALHPIDIIDASSGRLLRELVDGNLTTICPVNRMHPRRDLIISGSSRSLYLWAPVPGGELAAATASASTSMPQASSSGAAAGASGGGAGAASALRSSAKFTFFDADPGGKKTAGTKRKGGPGGKGGPADDSDDD